MEQPSQKLTLFDRKKLSMTGVEEIVSFDESEVVLNTCLGSLTVQGQELHLRSLSLEGGQVEVDGSIFGLLYQEPGIPGGWLSRLFK